jgi:hypothetical protein
VSQFIGEERIFTDPVRTFAYGTDASFYRLNPKMVIKVGLGVGFVMWGRRGSGCGGGG